MKILGIETKASETTKDFSSRNHEIMKGNNDKMI